MYERQKPKVFALCCESSSRLRAEPWWESSGESNYFLFYFMIREWFFCWKNFHVFYSKMLDCWLVFSSVYLWTFDIFQSRLCFRYYLFTFFVFYIHKRNRLRFLKLFKLTFQFSHPNNRLFKRKIRPWCSEVSIFEANI